MASNPPLFLEDCVGDIRARFLLGPGSDSLPDEGNHVDTIRRQKGLLLSRVSNTGQCCEDRNLLTPKNFSQRLPHQYRYCSAIITVDDPPPWGLTDLLEEDQSKWAFEDRAIE